MALQVCSSEIAQLVLEYLIEAGCHEAARIFQDTWYSYPPTVNDMRLANILKKRTLLKKKNGVMEGQPRQKRLTKDQKVVLNQLFTQKSSLDNKINLASKFGITKAQFQSWFRRMQNIEKKKKNGRIRLLEKQLNNVTSELKEVDSQLKELKENKQSLPENNQVSFNTSNDPGPPTPRSCLEQNESFNFSNSDDSD